MPAKNIRKKYISGGIYHIYNRGADKANIFIDDTDYKYFINLIDKYLSKTVKIYDRFSKKVLESPNNNDLHKYLKIHAFCLMPNHFHFLLKQDIKERSISNFMRRLCGSYAMYFNRKYARSGVLFQGRYKGKLIDNMDYYIKVISYIKLNYSDKNPFYEWGSHRYFVYDHQFSWLDSKTVIEYFGSKENYRDYIERTDPLKGPSSRV